MHQGSCLCGAVRFVVAGELSPAWACHCSQCRRQSGHYWVSTDVLRSHLTLHGSEALSWYCASERARRGFCKHCGSFLFWEVPGRERIAIAMGAFDPPTGCQLAEHIFVADKGDYYQITDGLPQRAQ